MKKKNKNYLNNADFHAALVEYRDVCREAESREEEVPRVPDYIARCLMSIAQGLGRSYKFNRYTFLDEMIADALENCIRYIRSFDPDRGKNPFSYFTQTVYYAFLRRINQEKKLLYVKYKLTDEVNVMNMGSVAHASEMGVSSINFAEIKHSDHTQTKINDFVENFERSNNLGSHKKKRRSG